jgi:RimJ/RimL family protein N-acetyltransferase
MTTIGPLSYATVAPSASTYRITLAGHLDDHWIDWLGGHALTRNDDASTTVTVEAVDQSQLHGVLNRIRDIGANLLAVCTPDCRPAPGPHLRDPDGRTPQQTTALPPDTPPALTRTLRTERLTLRPAAHNDAEPTWAYRRLDAVNEWLTGAPADFAEYRSVFCDPSRLAVTVIVELANDAEPHTIGDFMLRREDAWSQREVTDRAKDAQAELGWVLDPTHTGVGYATEAVRELLRYCFEELAVHRVTANCFLANDTSWRLMQRVGMRRETHAIEESLHRCGRWLDTVGYAVLADEWKRQNPRPRQESREPK